MGIELVITKSFVKYILSIKSSSASFRFYFKSWSNETDFLL